MITATRNTRQDLTSGMTIFRLALGLGLLLAILLLLLRAPSSEAQEIVVDASGNGNYTELSPALQYATQGDTILVRNGNYLLSSLNFRSGIPVMGENRDQTRIFLTEPSRTRYVYYDNVSISRLNFTSISPDNLDRISFYPGLTNCSIGNCSFAGLNRGVEIYPPSEGLVFENNSLWDTTLDFSYVDLERLKKSHLSNNTFNGELLAILVDEKDKVVDVSTGGLMLVNCTNVHIQYVEMSRDNNGIAIFYSSGIHVKDCVLPPAVNHGIYIYESDSISIRNNILGSAANQALYYDVAVFSFDSTRVDITGNTIHGGGITAQRGREYTIQSNKLTGGYGITLQGVRDADLTGNSMESRGIVLQKDSYIDHGNKEPLWSYHIIQENTVGDKAIYYYRNQSDVHVPGDAGQLLMVGCGNMTMDGIDISDVTVGAFLFRTTNSTITNSSFGGGDPGLLLKESEDIQVVGCTFTSSQLRFEDTLRSSIENCSFTFPGVTAVSLYRSNNNTIRNNSCRDSYRGIRLDQSAFTQVERNTIMNHTVGIVISHTSNSTFTRNNVSECSRGISLQNSQDNIISFNDIQENVVGVYIYEGVGDNQISYNNIHGNTRWGLEAEWDPDHTPSATSNWWGHPSGPFHIDENPMGYGDNASWTATIDPWLRTEVAMEEPGEDSRTEEPESSLNMGVPVLMIILVLVLVSLAFVMRLPDDHWKKKHSFPQQTETLEEADHSPAQPSSSETIQTVRTCPHCGGEFEVATLRRPINFTCHFCGKEIEFA